MDDHPVAVAFTGASGIQYGLRLVQVLVQSGCSVQVLYSRAAQVVAAMEADLTLPSDPAQARARLAAHLDLDPGRLQLYGRQEWTAPLASGSNPPRALVVCPCTTGTLASVAAGICEDLIDRAADVMLKERRPLILVVRETPFSEIHLENMLRLTRAGAVVMPANPGFYHRPQRVEALVDYMVARILDHLQVPHRLTPRWGEEDGAAQGKV